MFKKYDQKQQFLLPLNLEEFVSKDHISRVINELFDVVDISAIESTYSEDGCPAYHPRLLLKILFYGYLINIRSSRKIEGMTETDTAFMYLAAMQKPDFHTICRFRSTHLDSIKEIFSQIVTLCKGMGLIGSSISIDGTKVKANASPRQSKSSDAIEKRLTKYSGKALRPMNVKTKFMVIQHHIGCQKNWLTRCIDLKKLRLLRKRWMKRNLKK